MLKVNFTYLIHFKIAKYSLKKSLIILIKISVHNFTHYILINIFTISICVVLKLQYINFETS